jgi:uncharacterized Zn finger protein
VSRGWDYPEFESSRPLPTTGGITARSRRGAIGEEWWSRRFIELLESFGVGSRLKRGRTYARGGQVIELDVEPGIVLAKVQGSRYTPYKVRIRTKPLSDAQWRRVEKAMSAQALYLATLLGGEMPHEIEQVFTSCKLALFPKSAAELKASCTCPDWENPCKHVAATYYILAERFDLDPFLIFAWRGRDKDELLEQLRTQRSGNASRTATRARSVPRTPLTESPTPSSPASFWSSGPALSELELRPLAGPAPDALLRQLEPTPASPNGEELAELLAPAYRALAHAAERLALDQPPPRRGREPPRPRKRAASSR